MSNLATTVPQTVFSSNQQIESWLRSHSVTFTGPTAIKIVDIDVKDSRANQARQHAILHNLVKTYTLAIKNGDDLPAIVVFKKKNKWVIIDGNNRFQAAVYAGCQRVKAYIVDSATPSETILLLTMTANAKNGQRVDDQWMMYQSLFLIESGYTVKNVAAAMGLSVTTIAAYQRDAEAKERAKKLQISNWDAMPARTRQLVARIKLDKPFVIIAERAIELKFSADGEFGQMITKINATSSEEEAIAIASEWSKLVHLNAINEQRMGRKNRRTTNVKLGLLTGIGKVLNFDMAGFHLTFITDDDRQIIEDRIGKCMKKLVQMQAKLVGKKETEDFLLSLSDDLD